VVTASPRTGRRHQIRAHFYGIGHPVVGDLRYGDQKVQRRYPRLMLHAKRIELALPSGARAVIESPLPPSFGEGLEGLRAETATIERQSTRVN
jgi:23S rRNA-/tRNA-specific pseudouridylate synthase